MLPYIQSTLFKVSETARTWRFASRASLDFILISLATVSALFIETAFSPGVLSSFEQIEILATTILIYYVVFINLDVKNILWRHFGLFELRSLLTPTIVATLMLALMYRLSNFQSTIQFNGYSYLVICFLAINASLIGARVFRRVLFENQEAPKSTLTQNRKRLLLIGAGTTGKTVAQQLSSGDNQRKYEVAGFIDDDINLKNMRIAGVPILGTIAEIQDIVRSKHVDEVIITVSDQVASIAQRLINFLEDNPIHIRLLPPFDTLISSEISVDKIRDVQISDLLQRSPVDLDSKTLSDFLNGKTLLITGAGGSIGSEIVRQSASFAVGKIILLERSEAALFQIEQEIIQNYPHAHIVPIVGDVCNAESIAKVFAQYQPHIVYHAAAHKHVPLMEKNPAEAIKNNVLGTKVTGQAARDYKAEVFVLISTDKAVRPSSIMGASKRLAENVVKQLSMDSNSKFTAVRFGNVLGSSGSVVPIFKEQIRKGGPVTVTHPEMTRYFMTIPEACQLVMRASSMAEGGELFILDMGEPVKIVDLARQLILLSGFTPEKDIKISFSGIRPGEKLHEILHTHDHEIMPTSNDKIKKAPLEVPAKSFSETLEELLNMSSQQEEALRLHLRTMIPDALFQRKVHARAIKARDSNLHQESL